MPGSVIVSSARTPIGKLSGSLASFEATDLGGHAIAAALARAGIAGDQVDYVIMGQVLQAGAGQMPARQAAVKGGIPMSVPSMTVNKVCLSGIDAIYLADQMIQAGDAEVVVAGGMESMTKAPYLLTKAREGYRMGNGELLDSMISDGLWCAFDAVHMGAGTERYTQEIGGITRDQQDELAAKSHERAAAAAEGGPLRRDRADRDPAAQAATPSSSTPTRACARAPPPSRSAACAPRSRTTARSPPATRRRSPTVAPRSS